MSMIKSLSAVSFALKGAKVTSWCGDREKFLGRYHGYGNPAGVAEGTLCNEGNENGNSCGALSTVVRLAPESTVSSHFWLE